MRALLAASPLLLLATSLPAACSRQAAPAHTASLPVDPAALLDDDTLVAAPPVPGETVSGTIVLPAARRGDVARGDTLFVSARRAGGVAGPGSLLAAQRLQAGEFPLRFTLSARDAMIPGVPFEGLVSISVRVDKDGDPLTRRKGDVHGQADRIAVGTQDVVVSLGALQAEDVTLGGAGLLDQTDSLPPGHPALP
jgi:hypothetical protein